MSNQYHPPPPDYVPVERAPLNRVLERHIQTALAAILIGLVAWVGLTVTGNREQISRIDERLKFLSEDLAELKGELKQRAVPVGEIPHLQEQVSRIRDRQTALDLRISKLEGKYNRGAR